MVVMASHGAFAVSLVSDLKMDAIQSFGKTRSVVSPLGHKCLLDN